MSDFDLDDFERRMMSPFAAMSDCGRFVLVRHEEVKALIAMMRHRLTEDEARAIVAMDDAFDDETVDIGGPTWRGLVTEALERLK